MKIQKLPESELAIMKILWDCGEPVSSADIVERLPKEKGWKLTTVLTLLSRLIEKKFAGSQKKERGYNYYAIVEEKEYLKEETKNFLKFLHKGSLKSMFASLYESDGLDEAELEELEKWLQERRKGNA